MSFILDAIAKSEQERQQQEVPNAQVLALPVEKSGASGKWLPILLIMVLALNAIVLAIWMRSDSPEQVTISEQTSFSEETGNTAVVEIDDADSSPQRVVPTVDKDLDQGPMIEIGPDDIQPAPVASVTEDEAEGWVRVEPDTLLKNAREVSDAYAGAQQSQNTESAGREVSRLYDLPIDLRNDLPTVKFSGHLYSSDPGSSVVFLDNQRPVVQGQRIVDEVFLHEITPNGIVVEFRGYLISVGVLQNWTLN